MSLAGTTQTVPGGAARKPRASTVGDPEVLTIARINKLLAKLPSRQARHNVINYLASRTSSELYNNDAMNSAGATTAPSGKY